MDPRRVFTLLLVGLGLALPTCAVGETYKLPVRTATLGVSFDHYGQFVNGEPVGPYEFHIDPAVLRVGWDAATNWMYNSYVMLSFEEFSQVPAGARVYWSLYLATAWAPDGVVDYVGSVMLGAHTPIPELSDFDWSSQFETMGSPILFPVDQTLHDTYGPTTVPSPLAPGYMGWLLTGSLSGSLFGRAPIEIAGINNPYGLEGPHILVTTVPEPSSLVCLVAAVLLLGGLCARAGRQRLGASLLALALAASAGTWSIADLDSEPGERAQFDAVAGPGVPATATFPEDYAYLPALPRFLWSLSMTTAHA